MFSKKMLVITLVVAVLAVNAIILSVTSRRRDVANPVARYALALIGPVQKAVTGTLDFAGDIWRHYFFLVSAAREVDVLKKQLGRAMALSTECTEVKLSNQRLRRLLSFQKDITRHVIAAEVIGKDPSPWFKTVIIDKGRADGVVKGLPVVIPQGIAGQVITAAGHYAKVLLLIDNNSAVDALVQRTRARGIVKGDTAGQCRFEYVLRKNEIRIGDTVISSGLDGVFPKGLPIGDVSGIVKRSSGIFQEVMVAPFVDFEKLEEVLVLVESHGPEDGKEP